MRVTATLTVVNPERYFALAVNEFGVKYLLFGRNWDQMGSYQFDDAVVGDRVSFVPINGPKGQRGLDVRLELR